MTPEATEAFRALRVRLLHAVGDRDLMSIVVTSSLAGEGKTSVTANLAVALAESGKRVVIVAADLRRPHLQTYFQGSDHDVLTEVLPGKRQHEIAVSTTGTENLWVLHVGRETKLLDPSEYLGSESMIRLLAELRKTADFVLIDTPPLLSTSDVVAVAPLADAILMIVDPHLARRSRSNRPDTSSIASRFPSSVSLSTSMTPASSGAMASATRSMGIPTAGIKYRSLQEATSDPGRP